MELNTATKLTVSGRFEMGFFMFHLFHLAGAHENYKTCHPFRQSAKLMLGGGPHEASFAFSLGLQVDNGPSLSMPEVGFHSTPPTGGVESIRGNSVCPSSLQHFQ